MTEQSIQREDVIVRTGEVSVEGQLSLPREATAIVAFVHGSGSSRHSPRNRYVAEVLNEAGLATLLFDLLTAEEGEFDEATRELRFDIPLLGRRITGAVDWLSGEKTARELSIGLFGSSTGSAAALIAAAERPRAVRAVVSRGGRPDLAREVFPRVEAPTLLVVGGWDHPVVDLNREALEFLRCEKKLAIVPAASHLFQEPGKLEEAAALARDWFVEHLGQRSA